MTTVGLELLNEIERVTAKRERWRAFARTIPACALTVDMMTTSIDAAKAAVASGDVIACMRAYADLKGYDSDD